MILSRLVDSFDVPNCSHYLYFVFLLFLFPPLVLLFLGGVFPIYVHSDEQAAHIVFQLCCLEAERPFSQSQQQAQMLQSSQINSLAAPSMSTSVSSTSVPTSVAAIGPFDSFAASISSISSSITSSSSSLNRPCPSDSSALAAAASSSSSLTVCPSSPTASLRGAIFVLPEILQHPPPQLLFLLCVPFMTIGLALDLLQSFHYRLRDIINASPDRLISAADGLSPNRAQRIFDFFRRSLSNPSNSLASSPLRS